MSISFYALGYDLQRPFKNSSQPHSFSLFKAEESRYGTLHRHQSLFPKQTLLINLSPSSQFSPIIFFHNTSQLLRPVSHQLELREINIICNPYLRKKSRGEWGTQEVLSGKNQPGRMPKSKTCGADIKVTLSQVCPRPHSSPGGCHSLLFRSYEKDLPHPYCAPTLSSCRTRLV